MKFTLLVPALLSQLVAADFNADVSSAGSLASVLASEVSAWSSSDGLVSALGIQSTYTPFASAVNVASKDSTNLKSTDINTQTLATFVTNVIALLNGLTTKATDINATGAGAAVKPDIANLNKPAADLISNIKKVADCSQYQALSSVVLKLESQFSAADKAYGITPAAFPAFPATTC